MTEIRKPFSRVSVSVAFPERGRTKQSFKDECDINRIMAKYQRTGLVEFVNNNEARYGDFSGFDFSQSMNVVAKANEMFAQLPSNIRKRFNNDAVEFVSFIDDDANRLEAEKLGLVTPKPPVVATPADPPKEGV